MSYSFNVQAPTKQAAIEALEPKFDEVVASQPIHATDREAAVAAATGIIGLCDKPGDGLQLSVSVNGWLQYSLPDPESDDTEPSITGASVSVSVSTIAADA